MEEVVRLGLRADRERGDPSLGMGFTLLDAKGLRSAAGKRIDLTGDARVSPEEAMYARVQAEVVRQDKVGWGRLRGHHRPVGIRAERLWTTAPKAYDSTFSVRWRYERAPRSRLLAKLFRIKEVEFLAGVLYE